MSSSIGSPLLLWLLLRVDVLFEFGRCPSRFNMVVQRHPVDAIIQSCLVEKCTLVWTYLLCFRFQICLKGKVHIFKFLNIQACRLDKKPDTLDLPSLGKRCLPQPLTDRYQNASLLFQLLPKYIPTWQRYKQLVLHIPSMEDFYPSKNHGPDSGIGSDSGDKRLSTTEVWGTVTS